MPDPAMGSGTLDVPQTSIAMCPKCGHEVMTMKDIFDRMVYRTHSIPTLVKREMTICDNSLEEVE